VTGIVVSIAVTNEIARESQMKRVDSYTETYACCIRKQSVVFVCTYDFVTALGAKSRHFHSFAIGF